MITFGRHGELLKDLLPSVLVELWTIFINTFYGSLGLNPTECPTIASMDATMSSNSCSDTVDRRDSIMLIILARCLANSLRTWLFLKHIFSNISRAFCILPSLSSSSWSICNSEIFLFNLSILVLITLISSISFNNVILKNSQKECSF